MSTTMDEPASRTWWSIKSAEKSLRKTPTLKFTSLASAIGLKSKKPRPSLIIKDSPLSCKPAVVTEPSKSRVSQTPSSAIDSPNLRTPVDVHRGRHQSLLTLSDSDPFAGRSPVTVPVPHLPLDPNRLSAYSNSSVAEFAQKGIDGPTFSSHSNSPIADSSPSTSSHVHSGHLHKGSRKLRTKYSTGSLQVQASDPLSPRASLSPILVSHSTLGVSSTYGAKPRPNTHDGNLPSRPKVRPRGMTDSGITQTAGFFVEGRPLTTRKLSQKSSFSSFSAASPSSEPPSNKGLPLSPRVIVRQPSASRLYTPPTAPPSHSLPATPHSPIDEQPSHDKSELSTRPESVSSTCISFVSSDSFTNDLFTNAPYLVHEMEKRPSRRSEFSQTVGDHKDHPCTRETKTAPSSPRTLKKAISQQSLARRAPPVPKTPPEPSTPDRSSQKQKSFHHPRLPIPPIRLPLRHASPSNSTTFPTTTEKGQDTRRTSATSLNRRRLFSSSSRDKASTSHGIPQSEDDSRSLLSMRSEVDPHLFPLKPWVTKQSTAHQSSSASSSFWDEGNSDTAPNSPARSTHEYTPQHILSAAERAKLEDSVEVSSPTTSRGRVFSLLSTSTMFSDDQNSEIVPTALSPPPTSKAGRKPSTSLTRPSRRSTKSPPISPRPLTPPSPTYTSHEKQDVDQISILSNHKLLSAAQLTLRPPSIPAAFATSLPPPPRPRQRRLLTSESDRPSTSPGLFSPPSIVRKPTRPKTSVEKAIHRRSIMKKRSFLDIDDDTDKDSETEFISGSFLDLARESFDTVRTDV